MTFQVKFVQFTKEKERENYSIFCSIQLEFFFTSGIENLGM